MTRKASESAMETPIRPSISGIRNASPRRYTPWLFQHDSLLGSQEPGRPIELTKLINKINHVSFNDESVYLIFSQLATGALVMVKAQPRLCDKDEFTLQLSPSDAAIDLKNYELHSLLIDDGLSAIVAQLQAIGLEDFFLKTTLPRRGAVKNLRKNRRYPCDDAACKIIQGDFNVVGRLIDFSTGGLGISLDDHPGIAGFDRSKPAFLDITRADHSIYSGMCRCLVNRFDAYDSKMVFLPLEQQFSLYPKREIRDNRRKIDYAFSAQFQHPFFRRSVERDIFDISPAGFSIKDAADEDILLPGMFLPELTIVYAGIVKMNCSARVIYREAQDADGRIKYGLALTDMDLESYTRLRQVLNVTDRIHASISTDVDMEALWEFFFDTGFIDAEKLDRIKPRREEFKALYRKLYDDNPDIARHIVYKRNGRIYSHVAMIHAYEPAWLIHHFAARKMDSRRQGMMFLRHVIEYLGPYQRLQGLATSHYMTYYQPKNDIVEKLFDNFNRYINDSKKCSVDAFAHLYFHKKEMVRKLPADWEIRESTLRDLSILKEFYESVSGGLMFGALGLDRPADALKKSFTRAGFRREYRTYCLCHLDKPLAFFVVNRSDIKLNLSDLINGIKIIIVEPDILSWAMLAATVNSLGAHFPERTLSLMIYPAYFLSLQNIRTEKQYNLWILHAKAGDEWLAYLNRVISPPASQDPDPAG